MKTSSAASLTKILCPPVFLAVAALTVMPGASCPAQTVVPAPAVVKEETTTRETRVDGLLHLSGPESVTIRVGTAAPATYRYGQTIQFVDEAGNVVAREQIVAGTPVSVHTVIQPGGVVANRVIVHKSTATAVPPGGGPAVTTTTVTETVEKPTKVIGVLLEKEPARVLVQTEKDGNVTFMYSAETDFIDSDGKRVEMYKMVPGLPVQVDFKQVGDRLIANRVVVRGRVKD